MCYFFSSASILTETVKGKDISFLKKVNEDFINMIKNKTKITLNSLTEDQITNNYFFIWGARVSNES